jgi:hypothetical protein
VRRLGIRWTIGDVAAGGWEALRLSVWGALRAFGPQAQLAVVVNGVPVDQARERAGSLPPGVRWCAAGQLPGALRRRLDAGMAEGVAWKFAPLRLFPGDFELALDNDCVLWREPEAIRRWRAGPPGAVLAEDVKAAFGVFAPLCGDAPRNTGIRGLPPGFDLGRALEEALEAQPAPLTSELDEQGLQVAALSRALPIHVVRVDEVTICSPFPPHLQRLGSCGAHFVGLNARSLGWSLEGKPAEAWTREHFDRLRPAVEARVGLARSDAA